jgi:hypothetical protein
MAERSGGRFTQLKAPGEIVALLRSTSFSFVSSVRLANVTRGDEIRDARDSGSSSTKAM